MQILEPQDSRVLEKSYILKDWQGGYESLTQEYDYWIDDIEGEIPPELAGTLFRNGAGLLDINGERLHHPFDGDGMISRITFINGRAHFRNRFVQTPGYLAEQKAGKILYRGVFGTQKSGGWLANIFDFKLKNIANTNVIYWGKKLLALWEASEPYLLNPQTLETLGNEYFNGVLSKGEAFSAHPRIDPNGTLVNFAIKPGLSTTITIFELNKNGEITSKKNHSVPGFCFIHDFVITENYCIFFQNPVNFNPIPFALGICGAAECIKIQKNQPTKIIIIPRKTQTENVKVLETKAGFIFHHVNAFELENEINEIIVDSICYESLTEVEPNSDYRKTDFEKNSPPQLWRFNLNLSNNKVQNQLIDPRPTEFPTIHPNYMGKSYRYLYSAAAHQSTVNAPLQAIFKVDLESGTKQLWSAAPRGFVGEPIFVPRANSQQEDDGWIIFVVYNAENHRSEIVILDAQNLEKGRIAKLHLKHHIPYGLHGSFTPEIFI
ncbi:MAG: Apocarotenoid-15,15'-oxygenase [Aphanizomenon flos-aquae LD13]|jgi:all-trans-8'-apo-beta-carotenal 15,15'-oxygenase|uniref:Apocarotenoid-15,15'-oxygenase n=1 Tax=Aphanizomenon flos-aquae LD13 TaxID=1710894 RepID=A0A1B7W139_APHFL|nr:carotenoid oxygenase family protein [Aphanizomenon flos-aquae UKL13-PB]OBQ26992.1 MAG: Apocarotenoid-15,15'-oxygenase [Aphanizomenon flos-aquae LD13]HCQ23388.1 Apocarotenoid-15,15'-oxygenase [Anabaena sp. UBA12330]